MKTTIATFLSIAGLAISTNAFSQTFSTQVITKARVHIILLGDFESTDPQEFATNARDLAMAGSFYRVLGYSGTNGTIGRAQSADVTFNPATKFCSGKGQVGQVCDPDVTAAVTAVANQNYTDANDIYEVILAPSLNLGTTPAPVPGTGYTGGYHGDFKMQPATKNGSAFLIPYGVSVGNYPLTLVTFSHELAETITDPFPTLGVDSAAEVGDACQGLNSVYLDGVAVQELVGVGSGNRCVGYVDGPHCTYTTVPGPSNGTFTASCSPDASAAGEAVFIYKQTSAGWQSVAEYVPNSYAPVNLLSANNGTSETFVACIQYDSNFPDTPSTDVGCDFPATLGLSDPSLLWWDPSSDHFSVWLTSNSTVSEAVDLGMPCPYQNTTCSGHPIDGLANSILWWDPAGSGIPTPFTFLVGAPSMQSETNYGSPCLTSDGCANLWEPLGRVQEGAQAGLLWFEPSTGDLVMWDLAGSSITGSSVVGAVTLANSCNAGCQQQGWKPQLTVDMDGDGNTDILWWNQNSGQVQAWLMNGTAVKSTQNLSSLCSTGNGCAPQWRIAGAADVNHDGHTDLTWWNQQAGDVSSWLLDGHGNVTATQTLNGGNCNESSGCSLTWAPVGYVETLEVAGYSVE